MKRGSGIKESDLASAPCKCQLRIQFIPARSIGREQAKNLSICMGQPEKSTDQEPNFCFPAEIRHWAEKHVRLDSSVRKELRNLVGAPDCRGDKPAERASLVVVNASAGKRVQLKRQEIILQTHVAAVKEHLHFRKCGDAVHWRMKQIINIHADRN